MEKGGGGGNANQTAKMINQGNDSCTPQTAKNFVSGRDLSVLAEKLQTQDELHRSQSKRKRMGAENRAEQQLARTWQEQIMPDLSNFLLQLCE